MNRPRGFAANVQSNVTDAPQSWVRPIVKECQARVDHNCGDRWGNECEDVILVEDRECLCIDLAIDEEQIQAGRISRIRSELIRYLEVPWTAASGECAAQSRLILRSLRRCGLCYGD